MFSAYELRVIMFGPTASPVVHCQSTWHIGPTTCVFTPRSFARVESDASFDDSSHVAHRRQLRVDPARERDCLARVRADEARRAGDAVVQDVGADRPGCERTARHRCRQAAFGVRERNVHGLRRAAGLVERAVVGQRVRPELDLDRRRRHRDHRDADERLGRAGERLEVDRRDEPVRDRPSPRGAARSSARRSSGATSCGE